MDNITAPEKLAYTIDELAKAICLSKARLYELLNSGDLRAVKCGGRTLIPVDEARRFIRELPPAEFSGQKSLRSPDLAGGSL